ncbi:MAG: thiol peroxidase [Myxococcales bacterium]|jgi:thiol peroxidase|nr:thiol peroxidase [Myxococcales bacterium]
MATVTFKGNPVHTYGDLPAVGSTAPDFELVAKDLSEKRLADFSGKKRVLTINPSYNTGVCQATARKFNEKLGERKDVVVLAISADLPFAQKGFCEAEGLDHVVPLSTFRSSFAEDYGVKLEDGPLKGLTARAIVVLDEEGKVLASELVSEITNEPDYDKVLAALG